MCDVHVSIAALAAGSALSLHCDLLASNLIICLAWPHGSWVFVFGETLSDVVAICISWCQWYERVVHGSIGCCASSAIYLGLYFHCPSHAACTHTPFQKLAIALAIGFSSEGVLKYERLKHKKKKLECLVLSVFFFYFILLKDKFFPNERRREARVHEVTRLISVVPHWYARIRLFLLSGFVFWAIMLGDSFFCSFLFLLVYSIVYATSLITNLGEQYSLPFVDKKKKKAAKRWPCYSGEWKQAWRDKYLSLLLDVFSVWKPWHWGIKKKWKGEETEREDTSKKKKKRKGGVKASSNGFFAPERR